MTFTSDDLKRLKKMAEINPENPTLFAMNQFEISSLLARLEAAEAIVKSTPANGPLYIAWRKACGK